MHFDVAARRMRVTRRHSVAPGRGARGAGCRGGCGDRRFGV